MSNLRQQCARMVMVGLAGPVADEQALSLVDEGVCGAILFKRNVQSAAQTLELCRALKARAGRPFLLAVDQEGGRVARLRGEPFTSLPTMRALGQLGDEALAERAGRLLAYELRAVGFDWDFAPVLDVDTNPQNPVIGDRAFSSDAREVGRLGVALARGLEAGGVASCAKHFPGHGDTHQDSHLTLPRLVHSLERLREVELVPFVHYARAGLASVMTAHVIFEALGGLPATMSQPALEELLRRELGFSGVVVSDDLEMKAIADNYEVGEAAVQGALAGVDLFLVCHQPERQRQVIDALVRAVETQRLPYSRIEAANERLEHLATRFFLPAPQGLEALGAPEHRALAEGLAASFQGRDPTEPQTPAN